jgi:glyoxylase-like metal-dependent hydrolase (beta-lactamase superfamily II)
MSINKVETITNSEFKNSNGFIVYNDETKSAIIVNTAFGSLEQMQQFITSKGLEVCAIIIMSAHFENFVRLNEYCAAFPNVEIYMTIDDIPALFNPELNYSALYNTKYGSYVIQQPKKLKALMYDKKYNFCNIEFEVIHEGGSSKGSVMLDFFNEKVLLSGEILQGETPDKIIPDISVGNALIEDSIRRVFSSYDLEYTLYPTHSNVNFNLGDIMKYNIRVQRILAMK